MRLPAVIRDGYESIIYHDESFRVKIAVNAVSNVPGMIASKKKFHFLPNIRAVYIGVNPTQRMKNTKMVTPATAYSPQGEYLNIRAEKIMFDIPAMSVAKAGILTLFIPLLIL